MPIYEYECTKCGSEFEVIQGFSEKPLSKCEECGGKVRKMVSQSSFHLKGSGWYVTDYASSKRPGSKPAEKSEDSKSTTADSKSTTADSKADTAPKKSDKSKE